MKPTIQSAPTLVYPESDGEPMAETDAHRQLMMDFILMLEHHFQNVNDVYVSGNLLMYYEKGDYKKSVSPDVFVVFGVAKKPRRTYRLWEEARTPDFVLEVSSPSTYEQDVTREMALYASVLKVKEYYLYDPYGEVSSPFRGFRLVGGAYQALGFVNARLMSAVLGLELGEHEGGLRLYDPGTQQWLRPPQERVEHAEARAQAGSTRTTTRRSARRTRRGTRTTRSTRTTTRRGRTCSSLSRT